MDWIKPGYSQTDELRKWKRSNERMAKLRTNAVISGLSGKIGKDHYARHTRDGKTIICENPDFSNRQFSEAQLAVQSGMKAAAAYARVASRENPIYAKLAEKKSKKKVRNAYNVALRYLFACRTSLAKGLGI